MKSSDIFDLCVSTNDSYKKTFFGVQKMRRNEPEVIDACAGKWKLLSRLTHEQTNDGPAEYAIWLEADSEFIVGDIEDTGDVLTDEDYKDLTIKDYFKSYIHGLEEIKNADMTIQDMTRGRISKLWDLPATEGMKIFIHSESF